MKGILSCLFVLVFCYFGNAQSNRVVIQIKYLDNNPTLAKSVGNSLSDMFTEFASAYVNSSVPDLKNLYIADETKNKIIALWKRHKFRLPGKRCDLGAAKLYGKNEFAVFSVPLQVEGERNVVEYTIQFNSNGIITNFERSAFPLLNFKTGNRVVDDTTKEIIKMMLYQLSNAYNVKNMEYLRKIYDPEGYCIVGKKAVTQTPNSLGNELRIYLDRTYYDLTIKKLRQYLDDLQLVFYNNSWLNVKFGTPEITAHQNPDSVYDGIYYINVHQDYNSQTYNDKGWLTLVLNLRDKANPQILARIWLPEKITNEQLTNLF